ncbi:MAG TPA: 50S ribosomal protein L32e [Candidatus Limnocylindrales bacterium]|nr:50S ribosomal protein L32e [Candidatus Limnocylindrales bacterium]
MTPKENEKKPSPSRNALRLRARARNKKPNFVRAESWRYSRFSLSWRRQRGLDNKMRRKIKGWPPSPSVGYKGPKIARGLHPSGFREVVVYNAQELSTVDPNTQAVRIAHRVGKRNRATIIAEAKKLQIKILNVKVSAEAEKKEGEEEEAAASEEQVEEEAPKKEKKPRKSKPEKETEEEERPEEGEEEK